jgi:tetratricopeptide (TPR) repeat protein
VGALAGLGETYRQRTYTSRKRARSANAPVFDESISDFWSGIRAFDRALALDPDDAWSLASRGESYRQLAEAYEQLGHPDDAVAAPE